MANKPKITFKSGATKHKAAPSNIDISELPNKGDYINEDGHVFIVEKKTFISENDVIVGIEFELVPA